MTEEKKEQTHRSGFVNIVGNPNVGKSTLMNLLVGERVSIITSKAQTTRHRIMGIVNTPELQIVYSDTPGVLRPNYKLQESMLEFSESALGDADVLLYVTDTVETADKNEFFLERVRGVKCPVLLLINAGRARSTGRALASGAPRGRDHPALGAEQLQCTAPEEAYREPHPALTSLLREGRPHRQACPFLRHRDHP